jgi:hypothetical protein
MIRKVICESEGCSWTINIKYNRKFNKYLCDYCFNDDEVIKKEKSNKINNKERNNV